MARTIGLIIILLFSGCTSVDLTKWEMKPILTCGLDFCLPTDSYEFQKKEK